MGYRRFFRPVLPNYSLPHPGVRQIRYIIFLKDILILALSAFGGPQAHLAMMIKHLVVKRAYLTEAELIELNALCSVLPGPSSTQTITAIGYKVGGPNLAYLSLIVWVLPAITIMTLAGIFVSYLHENGISLAFTRFIQPMAVGFMVYGGYRIGRKVINTEVSVGIMVVAALVSFFLQTPWMAPLVLFGGGGVTAFRFQKLERKEKKDPFRVNWANFVLFISVGLIAAIIGGITRWLPIRLFENFYRNGSLIYGGGQALVPLLFTEFVRFEKKQYLSAEEFLSGLAIAQVVPGPNFSFTSFIGVLAMRDFGLGGEVLGSFMAAAGIFLPGTFLIFFVYHFWNQLKQYRIVRASLEGINAASTGLIASAVVLLLRQLDHNVLNLAIVGVTFCVLTFTRVPQVLIILAGLLLGILL
jgi:chromate transporter